MMTWPKTEKNPILRLDTGFDLQFVERKEEMLDIYNATQLQETCSAWDAYVEEAYVVQEDSGV